MRVRLQNITSGVGPETGIPWSSSCSIYVDIPEDEALDDDAIDSVIHPALGVLQRVAYSWNRWGRIQLDIGGDVIR